MPAVAAHPAVPRAGDDSDYDHRDERRTDPERRGVAHRDRGRVPED
jgi:hypothetical protein